MADAPVATAEMTPADFHARALHQLTGVHAHSMTLLIPGLPADIDIPMIAVLSGMKCLLSFLHPRHLNDA